MGRLIHHYGTKIIETIESKEKINIYIYLKFSSCQDEMFEVSFSLAWLGLAWLNFSGKADEVRGRASRLMLCIGK